MPMNSPLKYKMAEADVLVIGGGGAGCRAAIEAHDQGAEVLMAVKGNMGNSGCTLNVGTSAAVGPWAAAGDSNDVSLRDLISYGGFLGNQDLAKTLVNESMDRLREMECWGIGLEKDENGHVLVNRSGGHSFPRNFTFKSLVSGNQPDYGSPPGIALMGILVAEVQKRKIRVLEDVMLIDLVKAGERVAGATALNHRENSLLVLKATTTVLATGTYSQVFSPTTVSEFETGDGQVAALRAGAELVAMESTQFVSTSVPCPPGSAFINAYGEEFLSKYGIESIEGIPKEPLSYAVWHEIRAGRGTERETVFLDMSKPLSDPDVAAKFLPRIRDHVQKGGIYDKSMLRELDPANQPVESTPRAHTTIGGVKINERCETNIPGLFAAGAVAGGVYGLARPEGYTSMITLVFGRRAGLFAAQESKRLRPNDPDPASVSASLDKARSLIGSPHGLNAGDVLSKLKSTMREHAWVIKSEEELVRGLEKIKLIASSSSEFVVSEGFEWARALEVHNLLTSAEMLLLGSIERRESRGAFFREDYPLVDDERWLKNLIYTQENGEIVVKTAPVSLKYVHPGPNAQRSEGWAAALALKDGTEGTGQWHRPQKHTKAP